MNYEFKLLEEAAWAFFIAALVFALTALAGMGNVESWQDWAVTLAIGCARAGAGAALAQIAKWKKT